MEFLEDLWPGHNGGNGLYGLPIRGEIVRGLTGGEGEFEEVDGGSS